MSLSVYTKKAEKGILFFEFFYTFECKRINRHKQQRSRCLQKEMHDADADCLTERFHHDVPIEMSYLIVILLSTALYCDKSPPSLST